MLQIAPLLTFVFVLALATSSTPPMVIDHFDTPKDILALEANYTTPQVGATQDTIGVWGGERDVALYHYRGYNGLVAVTPFDITNFAFSEGALTRGNAVITWDGDDNDPFTTAYGLNKDLSNDDGIHVQYSSVDVSHQIQIKLFTSAIQWSYATATISPAQDSAFILFSSFSIGAGASFPVQLSNVNAIQLRINSTNIAGVDAMVDYVSVVKKK